MRVALRVLAVSRYANGLALYSKFGRHRSDLTTARLINSNRRSRPATCAQVAELVDALASGASGLTAVKVRVLSWAPFLVPSPHTPAERIRRRRDDSCRLSRPIEC